MLMAMLLRRLLPSKRKNSRASRVAVECSQWKLPEHREQPSYGRLTKYSPLKQLRVAMHMAMLLRRLLATKRMISRASSCR